MSTFDEPKKDWLDTAQALMAQPLVTKEQFVAFVEEVRSGSNCYPDCGDRCPHFRKLEPCCYGVHRFDFFSPYQKRLCLDCFEPEPVQ